MSLFNEYWQQILNQTETLTSHVAYKTPTLYTLAIHPDQGIIAAHHTRCTPGECSTHESDLTTGAEVFPMAEKSEFLPIMDHAEAKHRRPFTIVPRECVQRKEEDDYSEIEDSINQAQWELSQER